MVTCDLRSYTSSLQIVALFLSVFVGCWWIRERLSPHYFLSNVACCWNPLECLKYCYPGSKCYQKQPTLSTGYPFIWWIVLSSFWTTRASMKRISTWWEAVDLHFSQHSNFSSALLGSSWQFLVYFSAPPWVRSSSLPGSSPLIAISRHFVV